jgi:hypothetical protein
MLELELPVVVTRTVSGEHYIRHMTNFYFDFTDTGKRFLMGESIHDLKLEMDLTEDEYTMLRPLTDRVDNMNFVLKNIHRVKPYKKRETK